MHRPTGSVEKIRRKADHRFDEVFFEQKLADIAFGAFAKKRALGENDGHAAARFFGHRRDLVLDEGVVAVRIRGKAVARSAIGIALPDLASPVFERKRGIGDHAIELRQSPR